MFKSIRLQNFKSYKDSGEIPLAPLTVLVGLNNSGKSSILQAILALKQTALDSASVAPNRPAFISTGSYATLNGFYDILHKPQTEASFSISLELDKTEEQSFISGGDRPETRQAWKVPIANKLDVSFCLGAETKEIEVERSVLTLNDEKILEYQRNGHVAWSSDKFPFSTEGAGVFLRGFTPALVALPTGTPNPGTGDFFTALQQISAHSYMWITWLGSRVHRVGAIRTRVPYTTSVGVRTPPEFGLGGENLLAALANEERRGPANRTLVDEVNDWLSKTRILNKVHLKTDKANNVRMLLGDEMRGGPSDINVAGMGEGISQILPIIALAVSVNPRHCLLIEQPEIHLHPALQADLADLFISVSGEHDRQVIVETHSEHLVLRIRHRIASGTLDPQNVRILFVEKSAGESTVRPLDVSDTGEVTNWPDGFFDEAYSEAMAMVEAAAKRRATSAH
ncbi:MAG TPA: DUF3696 domain-containing protein [Pirellulales bacterium]|nr:DUF3696 domain-containing protein [Pirellulales bacterium]